MLGIGVVEEEVQLRHWRVFLIADFFSIMQKFSKHIGLAYEWTAVGAPSGG